MDAHEFQELVAAIRENLDYSIVGLNMQQIQHLNQRLDSDAYAAANAVIDFFEAKRNQTCQD